MFFHFACNIGKTVIFLIFFFLFIGSYIAFFIRDSSFTTYPFAMTVLMGNYFVAPSLQVERLVVFRRDNELILSFGDQYSYVFSYSKEKLFIRFF